MFPFTDRNAPNPLARPDLSALVDPFSDPLVSAALSRLGPGVLLYYLILAAGASESLRLGRLKACSLAGSLYAAVSLAHLGLGALGQLQLGTS